MNRHITHLQALHSELERRLARFHRAARVEYGSLCSRIGVAKHRTEDLIESLRSLDRAIEQAERQLRHEEREIASIRR